MPVLETKGAISAQGFGLTLQQGEVNYIEDVFSTWLYTGNGSTQTITNGIDLAGKGGLTWIKSRNAGQANNFYDTARGVSKVVFSNSTSGEFNFAGYGVTNFGSTGFSVTDNSIADYYVNGTGTTYVSWTFREQPKFFDVVTYTGNGATQTINHNLAAAPGVVIIKKTNATGNWYYMHNIGASNCEQILLNSTAAGSTSSYNSGNVFSARASSTSLFLGSEGETNSSGGSFVAYLFAHNAGGFGLTGTDNVISCGSYTGNGSTTGQQVTLGYEPQWVLIKNSTSASSWRIVDTMRGFSNNGDSGTDAVLFPDQSIAEINQIIGAPNATGFIVANDNSNASGQTYIYIAIRRGPMKVPTTGTSVLGINARTGTSANATVTGGTGVTDLAFVKNRGDSTDWIWVPRLTGTSYLRSNNEDAQSTAGTTILQTNPWDVMNGVKVGTTSNQINLSGNTYINYLLARAPSFFDVVCYTGNNGGSFNHNLGAIPELMLVKRRNAIQPWCIYSASQPTQYGYFDAGAFRTSFAQNRFGNGTTTVAPTATVFTLGGDSDVNTGSATYINYLFTSCPGVSSVGSYTGTGAIQTINCGFTGGARFVFIKATSTTGDWYIWDSARGIGPFNDPYIRPNDVSGDVTGTSWVGTDTTGFQLTGAGGNLANSNGVSYIFLAIA
jgi:hypothetical protein